MLYCSSIFFLITELLMTSSYNDLTTTSHEYLGNPCSVASSWPQVIGSTCSTKPLVPGWTKFLIKVNDSRFQLNHIPASHHCKGLECTVSNCPRPISSIIINHSLLLSITTPHTYTHTYTPTHTYTQHTRTHKPSLARFRQARNCLTGTVSTGISGAVSRHKLPSP